LSLTLFMSLLAPVAGAAGERSGNHDRPQRWPFTGFLPLRPAARGDSLHFSVCSGLGRRSTRLDVRMGPV